VEEGGKLRRFPLSQRMEVAIAEGITPVNGPLNRRQGQPQPPRFATRCLCLRGFWPASVPVERRWVDADDDILGLGVEIHGVAAQFAAETALLVAAEDSLRGLTVG
jgi:hypothetical protein